MPGLGLAQAKHQELNPGLPCGWQGPKTSCQGCLTQRVPLIRNQNSEQSQGQLADSDKGTGAPSSINHQVTHPEIQKYAKIRFPGYYFHTAVTKGELQGENTILRFLFTCLLIWEADDTPIWDFNPQTLASARTGLGAELRAKNTVSSPTRAAGI